ncbi:MAG: epoxyqueuosine reductase QueH [Sulfurospirillaceae bacterium]|nr:epoxyqueuosine reductase QueH [Sulfurospirillaceae bacterium]
MLVHICCSVDSHFFLQKLATIYPKERLIGFFYDPNIHPYNEYLLRLEDVRRSCEKLKIELIEGDYDFENWLCCVNGLENEPEKGKRCNVCFDNRLEKTALKALEIGEKMITTTLLTSPKKSIESLSKSLEAIAQKYNLSYVAPDFRINGGTTEQFALAKKDKLYHQNYCGCMFALEAQRKEQNRYLDELCTPITKQILPSSIEERLELFRKVQECEKNGIQFSLERKKFLNYRLLRAFVKNPLKNIVPSYFMFYSIPNKTYQKVKIQNISKNQAFTLKQEAFFISIEGVNLLAKTSYKSVMDLIQNPLHVAFEISLREMILPDDFISLTPIIIIDELIEGNYEVYCDAIMYSDVREVLAIIS